MPAVLEPNPAAKEQQAQAAIETAAQAVLDARAQFPDSTLADLYDPLTMPPALRQGTPEAGRRRGQGPSAVRRQKLRHDAERVAFLFERYQQLTSLLPAAKTLKAPKPAKTAKAAKPRGAVREQAAKDAT